MNMTSRPARRRLTLVATAALLAGLAAAPRAALATRFAVVIGSDVGGADEPRLKYAETDARRIAEVLISIGDFPPENTVVLAGPSAAEVRAAIEAAEERLTRSGEDGLLLVYYSGHADSTALHVRHDTIPLRDLQEVVRRTAVATRVMVIDACRSGALTQTKGGRAGGNFDMQVTPATEPHGMAILTSSAAGEDSQESDELRASFFTHHLASGLLGAADGDRDGAVTLAEAFGYAARHTLAATSTTVAGPQHPTFRIDLGGREDLVLTRPGAASGRAAALGGVGHLELREPGWYFIRRKGESALVAEITSDTTGRPLALAAGPYEVTRRGPQYLLTGTFAVSASASTPVTEAQMRRIDYGRVVRKGGTARRRAVGLFIDGGLRGSLLDLGTAPTVGGGARVDLSGLSAIASLDWGASSKENGQGTSLSTSELHLGVGAFKAFDASVFTWSIGADAGVGRLVQTTVDQSRPLQSYALTVGPSAIAELPVGGRYFVWLQASLPVYLVDVTDNRVSGGRSLHVTYRGLLATGGYL
jgi:hypothetical protein